VAVAAVVLEAIQGLEEKEGLGIILVLDVPVLVALVEVALVVAVVLLAAVEVA